MPAIDESIRKIDNVICRHLDEIENSSRGAISQDILEQLIKLVNHIMLKFYADNLEIDITEENIEKAARYAQVTSKLSNLYRFRKFLKVVTVQYTLDEDGSERLMLKYFQYLLEAKNLLQYNYGIEILHNLHKFPLKQDTTLQEYYEKIKEKLCKYPTKQEGDSNRYYIQKVIPRFVGKNQIFREVTFVRVDDRKNQSKTERVIAFTSLPINKRYASKFHLVEESIEILGKKMPITIIDGWEVSIRPCEFKNFASLVNGWCKDINSSEQKVINQFLTSNNYVLSDLMEFHDDDYRKITSVWRNRCKSDVFVSALDQCRNLIRTHQPGQNVLRYLLYHMNNAIIKGQRGDKPNERLSNLYLDYKSKPFDSIPFNSSLHGHNPRSNILFECIPIDNRKHELLAHLIKNNTEVRGHIFTDINDIIGYENIPTLISKYNYCLYSMHRPDSSLKLEYDQVFINGYKNDTCKIVKKLQELSAFGVENYQDNVDFWLDFEYPIDCGEKEEIVRKIFSKSRVGVIYGSAGVGKSTLINHVSHFLEDSQKLYLTQTHPALENLKRRIDAEADNIEFSTIKNFLSNWSDDASYDLLVIDECSTVSNRNMVKILEKANFNMLLLVGDTYQIDAIEFGNWFAMLSYFLPESAVFELTKPYRTKDLHLLDLWDKVRHMDDTVKEVLNIDSISLKVDNSLFTPIEPDEAILCLNYDGLYGINNINRFLQENNPNPAVKWDVQQFKAGDPILFLETNRFDDLIYNNMKGIIRGIEVLDKDTQYERIQFDIEIPKKLKPEDEMYYRNLQFVECGNDKSIVRFSVYKQGDADEDNEREAAQTTVPFQIAYAVSIHKAQGLEYDSVKIVITDEVEELVTHDIFYTAITRARKQLKVYWTPEVEEKVLKRIKPKDISKDVEILRKYLKE